MNYQDSIRAVNIAQRNFYHMCQWGNDGDEAKALQTLHRLKEQHKEQYGPLMRVDGEWV
jgi:hypothetical protein